jgi:hypothetical protein
MKYWKEIVIALLAAYVVWLHLRLQTSAQAAQTARAEEQQAEQHAQKQADKLLVEQMTSQDLVSLINTSNATIDSLEAQLSQSQKELAMLKEQRVARASGASGANAGPQGCAAIQKLTNFRVEKPRVSIVGKVKLFFEVSPPTADVSCIDLEQVDAAGRATAAVRQPEKEANTNRWYVKIDDTKKTVAVVAKRAGKLISRYELP